MEKTLIEDLQRTLQDRYPYLLIQLQRPFTWDGTWYMDLDRLQQWMVVEWHSEGDFVLNPNPRLGDLQGSRSTESFSSPEVLLARLDTLLTSS